MTLAPRARALGLHAVVPATLLAMSAFGCGTTTFSITVETEDADAASSGDDSGGGSGSSSDGAGCPVGTVDCSGVCVDLLDDDDNCGECGERCDGVDVCRAGACVSPCDAGCSETTEVCGVDGFCACRPGLLRCGEDCVDLLSDATHCGTCGMECPAVCDAGSCAATCSTTPDTCGDACVDTQVHPLHCGACGEECLVTETCEGGSCG